jgi:hypothetical protein
MPNWSHARSLFFSLAADVPGSSVFTRPAPIPAFPAGEDIFHLARPYPDNDEPRPIAVQPAAGTLQDQSKLDLIRFVCGRICQVPLRCPRVKRLLAEADQYGMLNNSGDSGAPPPWRDKRANHQARIS